MLLPPGWPEEPWMDLAVQVRRAPNEHIDPGDTINSTEYWAARCATCLGSEGFDSGKPEDLLHKNLDHVMSSVPYAGPLQ